MSPRGSERWDAAFLGFTAAGLLIHVADLLGATHPVADGVARAIDVAFVADFVARLARAGPAYRAGPWVVVDGVSALPAVAEVVGLPGLELLRLARVLRALRALRVLRGLRGVPLLDWAARPAEPDDPAASWRIRGLVLGASASLVALATGLRAAAPTLQAADLAEAGLTLGATVGLVLVVRIAQIQAEGAAGAQLRGLLEIALPHQAARAFLADPATASRVERAPGTVLFCDLRGFSAAVETRGLDALRDRLGAALGAIVDAHVAEDLLVDKLLGDAVMSFRAGTLVPGDGADHARRCVRAALACQRAVAALHDPDLVGVKTGGASAPDLWVGAFTGGRRLVFTALHDRVNLAARLEAACGSLGTEALFDEATYTLAGDLPGVTWRRVGRLVVHGKAEVVTAWEALVDGGPWVERFRAALDAWDLGERAPDAFLAVDEARPRGDALSRFYAARCRAGDADGVIYLGK